MSLDKLSGGVGDGTKQKVLTKDEDAMTLLTDILTEMRKMNFQLALMTDTYIHNEDVSDG